MDKKLFLHICIVAVLFVFVPCLQAREKTFTIVIDAGHGGKDPGARGASINEKEINLSVALKFGKMLEDRYADVKVVYTRSSDKFIELDERANIANRHKADLFISIHTNAVKTRTVRGTETYTLGLARSEENLEVAMRENSAILLEDNYLQKYEGFDPNSSESYIIFEFMQNKHMEQSIGFASEIQKSFVSVLRSDRGVRQAGFLVLRKTSMPSVLVELGYISNQDEERFMKSVNGQKQLADALYAAFAKYKREYDRKQGVLTDATPIVVESPAPVEVSSPVKTSGEIVYKIQILASDRKLPANSKLLKGYKSVDYYQEKGMYKYTYGESTSFEEIRKLRKIILKDFKDSFIISFKNGKKITN